jgi:5-formyltetrahydrofolate cyclo-ligase
LIFLKEVLSNSTSFFVAMSLNKQQLRKQYQAKRAALTGDSYAILNEQLLQLFKTIDFTGIGCLHIFLPMISRKEPDTQLLINWLKATHPEIRLAYPKTDFLDFTILNFFDNADLRLEINAQGITEPVKGNMVDIAAIDMVIVPLLIFDMQGYRVGYGKGFYDRFMAKCKPQTQFIGLSLFDPVDSIEDIDGFDIPLHQCVTPQKVWRF